MCSGHFAAGLALSARFRRVPPIAIFVGVGFVDLIDGALVAAGVERVKPTSRCRSRSISTSSMLVARSRA